MIRRITLENYMSHGLTVIEPAQGLTVLIGPNNCGKSAVVSALQSVCGDNAGDFMVRHGEKLTRVTVETAEGDTIVWQRKGASPSYVINGRQVNRVGRGERPDDLDALLKLPRVESADGKKNFPVHFGLQKSPIFLLDSESDTATFFSSSAEAERLLEMQKRHKKRTQDARNEQRTIEADLAQLGAKLESLSPLDDLAAQVEVLEARHQALTEEAAQIEKLSAHIGRVAETRHNVSRCAVEAEALESLQALPVLADAGAVERLIDGITKRGAEIARLAAREQAMAALTEPPAPADPQPLVDFGRKLSAAGKSVDACAALVAAVDALLDPPAWADAAPIAQMVERVSKAVRSIADSEKGAKALESDFADVQRAMIEWITQNPVCPVCGGDVEREKLLAGGHAHG